MDEAVISDGSRQRAAAAGPHRSTRLGFHGLPWDNPEQKGARSNPRQTVTQGRKVRALPNRTK